MAKGAEHLLDVAGPEVALDAYNESDPWKSVYAFGGNGDGTLFYPGTPERIGGRTHIPVESLRIPEGVRSA